MKQCVLIFKLPCVTFFQSEDEIERCTRTIYITNIDKKVIKNKNNFFFCWLKAL